jgi:hypothetical protein
VTGADQYNLTINQSERNNGCGTGYKNETELARK